jgi:hypothetical protein
MMGICTAGMSKTTTDLFLLLVVVLCLWLFSEWVHCPTEDDGMTIEWNPQEGSPE